MKQNGEQFVKEELDSNVATEKDNLKDKKRLKEDYAEADKANIGEVAEEEERLKGENRILKDTLETQKTSLIQDYEKKCTDLRDQLELRMKVEIHEIEERKNQHINELMINHETAFREMKEYYNDITRENIELIKVHKEKLKDIKTSIQSNSYIVADL